MCSATCCDAPATSTAARHAGSYSGHRMLPATSKTVSAHSTTSVMCTSYAVGFSAPLGCYEECVRIGREVRASGKARIYCCPGFACLRLHGEQGDYEGPGVLWGGPGGKHQVQQMGGPGRSTILSNIGETLRGMGALGRAAEVFPSGLGALQQLPRPASEHADGAGQSSLWRRSDYENAALTFQAIIAAERETQRAQARCSRLRLWNWVAARLEPAIWRAEETLDSGTGQ